MNRRSFLKIMGMIAGSIAFGELSASIIRPIQIGLAIEIGAQEHLGVEYLLKKIKEQEKLVVDQNKILNIPILLWKSSNPSVATISNSGVVKGISAGSAVITASALGITSNTFIITVISQNQC